MRRTLRWRIAATVSALVLATGMLVVAAPITLAEGPGTMEWTGTIWRDPDCGSEAQQFDVRLFRDTNYGGTTWKFCTASANLCWNPHGSSSSDALLCGAGFDGGTVNDYPSSLKVKAVGGGTSCRVRLYVDPGYEGASLSYWDPVDVPSLVPWPNDALSSLRRVC